jgi:PAS domain S-box-containing protein
MTPLPQMNRYQEIGKIVVIYALFGSAWIYFSDTALGWLIRDPSIMTKIAVFKGLFFILFTSILLYFLIARLSAKIRQTTDALHESEKRLRFLLMSSSDCMVILNADGSQRYVSPGAERITGFPISELEGRTIDTLIHPDDMPNVMAAWNEAIRHPERTVTVQYRHIHKTREWVFSEAIAQSFLDEPAINGVIASVRDITERKQADEALLRKEALLQAMLRNLPFDFWARDTNERIIMQSDESIRLWGDLFKSEIPEEQFDDQTLSTWRSNNLRALAGETISEDCTLIIKNGERRQFHNIVVPIREGTEILGILGINIDITDRKHNEEARIKLEEQLQQVHKMEAIGQLAGGVAHDFNNMLGVILGHAELAMDTVDPSQMLYTDLEEIRKAATRSADITRQLLAFARKQTIIPKIIDLNTTVVGMLKMLRRLIGEDIDLAWMPGNALWQVKVDPSQIDQILANLCLNARDAIVGVGRITVETGNVTFDEDDCSHHPDILPGDHVMLAVSDTGCGIEKETLLHIFEPFFTTKDVGEGTGLGLAMVYGAVKQNNGFINVYSEPEMGTTIRIYLPRHLGNTEPLRSMESTESTLTGHETILLVEDEPTILNMASAMLQRLGYSVIAASTPGQAMQLAKEFTAKIELLITDVIMPEMNGRELARNLLPHHPEMKCLFMSGYTANIIANQGVLDDGVNFIQKPFSRIDLGTKVREVLEAEQ